VYWIFNDEILLLWGLAKSSIFWVFLAGIPRWKSGKNPYFLLFKLHFWMHRWIQHAEKPLRHLDYTNFADPTIPYQILSKIERKKSPKNFQKVERLDYCIIMYWLGFWLQISYIRGSIMSTIIQIKIMICDFVLTLIRW